MENQKIKNLVITDSCVKKLKQFKTRLIATALTGAIFLSSGTAVANAATRSDLEDNSYSYSTTNRGSNYSLSQESFEDFANFICNQRVEYPYSNLYGINAAINAYQKTNIDSNSSSKVIIDNSIDADKLYNIVLANNDKYKYNNKDNIKINNSKLKEIVLIITDYLNELLANGEIVDVQNLDYNLNNLKIFEYQSFGNAYVDFYEPILRVNFKSIAGLEKTNEDALRMIIRHEASHLIQSYYLNNKDFYNLGVCYNYNKLDVNPLYWQWYIEGSADVLALSEGEQSINYYQNVKEIEALNFVTLLNEDSNFSIEALSMQNDLNEFFNKIDFEGIISKEEIIQMMFGYDIVYTKNEQFVELLKEKLGNNYSYEKMLSVQASTRSSICQTLTKVFYLNLSKYLTEHSLQLEDVCALISTFETEMNRIVKFDTDYYEDSEKFVKSYTLIQDSFFEQLAKSNSVSASKIRASFYTFDETYFSGVLSESYSFNIEGLSKEQNEFLNHLRDTRKTNSTQAVAKAH